MFLEISQNLHENARVRVSFLIKLQAQAAAASDFYYNQGDLMKMNFDYLNFLSLILTKVLFKKYEGSIYFPNCFTELLRRFAVNFPSRFTTIFPNRFLLRLFKLSEMKFCFDVT